MRRASERRRQDVAAVARHLLGVGSGDIKRLDVLRQEMVAMRWLRRAGLDVYRRQAGTGELVLPALRVADGGGLRPLRSVGGLPGEAELLHEHARRALLLAIPLLASERYIGAPFASITASYDAFLTSTSAEELAAVAPGEQLLTWISPQERGDVDLIKPRAVLSIDPDEPNQAEIRSAWETAAHITGGDLLASVAQVRYMLTGFVQTRLSPLSETARRIDGAAALLESGVLIPAAYLEASGLDGRVFDHYLRNFASPSHFYGGHNSAPQIMMRSALH